MRRQCQTEPRSLQNRTNTFGSDKDVGHLKDLLDRHTKKKTLVDMFSAVAHKDSDDLCASYNIAFLIAKAGKAHTIDVTLIAPVIREAMTTVLKKDPEPILRALSNSTVQW